ncbi:MAG: hypothetical protein ACLVIP_15680 [Ruminococcus sp.]
MTSSGGYRQRADREASQSENPTTEKDSFNAENNTAGQYPCLAGITYILRQRNTLQDFEVLQGIGGSFRN